MITLPVAYPGDQTDGATEIRFCVRCHLDFLAVQVPGLNAFDPAGSRFPDLCVLCRVLEARALPDRSLPLWAMGT